jgi:CDP-6-deoxy-D-xylo-4-hexulose-3-dehydrase
MIEDCCDALGATLNSRHVGTFGDIGTFSFYPAHHITMGEGGAVFTQNPILRRAMETFNLGSCLMDTITNISTPTWDLT